MEITFYRCFLSKFINLLKVSNVASEIILHFSSTTLFQIRLVVPAPLAQLKKKRNAAIHRVARTSNAVTHTE